MRTVVFSAGIGAGLGIAGSVWVEAVPASAQPLTSAAAPHPASPHPPTSHPDSTPRPANSPPATSHPANSHLSGTAHRPRAFGPAHHSTSGTGSVSTAAVLPAGVVATAPNQQTSSLTGASTAPEVAASGRKPGHGKGSKGNHAGGVHAASALTKGLATQSHGKSGHTSNRPAPTSVGPTATDAAGPTGPRRFVSSPGEPTLVSSPGAPTPAPTRHPTGVPSPVLQPTVPGRGWMKSPLDFLGTTWAGESLQAAAKLKIPIALLVAIGLFFLVQALIDRRDPKVAQAPEHQRDDSVGFE